MMPELRGVVAVGSEAEANSSDGSRAGDESRAQPMLVLVTDDAELAAGARAGARDVRTWANAAGSRVGGRVFGGDPAQPETFEWAREAPAVTFVIALEDAARAEDAMRAARAVRPDSAVLILHDDVAHAPGDGTLARAGRLRDVVRIDLDDELQRLEAQRRLFCLRSFAEPAGVLPILIHPAPDPDALASAFAIRILVGRSADAAPLVTLADTHRPENVRMARLLKLSVVRVSEAELRGFERIVAVDHQPANVARAGGPRLAVLDHHPRERGHASDYADIRPEIGATATIATQYLRADPSITIGRPLATALLYGIRTDTAGLIRGVTAADVEAYAFLQSRADLALLRRIERPTYKLDTARSLAKAVAGSRMDRDMVVVWAGRLGPDDAHTTADLADLCLSIEGAIWAVVGARVDARVVVTIRHHGDDGEAGRLARSLAGEHGSGGGHATMARVEWPADAEPEIGDAQDDEEAAHALLRRVRATIDAELRSRS